MIVFESPARATECVELSHQLLVEMEAVTKTGSESYEDTSVLMSPYLTSPLFTALVASAPHDFG